MRREHRVLVVARDPLARAGLAALIGQNPDIDVVGQAADRTELDRLIDDIAPDAIVFDAGWDTEAALDAMRDPGDGAPPVIVLLPDELHAGEAFAAGARAILPRDASGDVIATALSAAVEGLTVLGPRFADAILTAPERRPDGAAPDLTPRELQVLRLVAEGQSNKEIAFDLDISDHTVKFHVNSILAKLAARSRTEAVTNAARLGLLYL